MKNLFKKGLGIALISLATVSFTTIKKEKKQINISESNIEWKAYKVTGSHKGKVNVKSGYLSFDDGKLSGGSITIDMTSINTTDLTGDYKNQLDGHLKSGDFFSVEKHNTSILNFTKVKAKGKNTYEVTGKLTIKGITKSVKFLISIYGNKATASLKVDRTKFNIKYGSSSFFDNLKDKAIYDEFDLVADLQLK
ncbi:YceI family protein [uncultured Tenacibaculum sp.]|uniref:YceI family protein n=1 Tax=uncultured Tenacibaculum sp. TaxID=174713 RepID=UPI00260E8C3F|nr:YceI family protein [uncultured Tenacibaculum sp.]